MKKTKLDGVLVKTAVVTEEIVLGPRAEGRAGGAVQRNDTFFAVLLGLDRVDPADTVPGFARLVQPPQEHDGGVDAQWFSVGCGKDVVRLRASRQFFQKLNGCIRQEDDSVAVMLLPFVILQRDEPKFFLKVNFGPFSETDSF